MGIQGIPNVPSENTRFCSKCERNVPLSLGVKQTATGSKNIPGWYRSNMTASGYQAYCAECMRNASKRSNLKAKGRRQEVADEWTSQEFDRCYQNQMYRCPVCGASGVGMEIIWHPDDKGRQFPRGLFVCCRPNCATLVHMSMEIDEETPWRVLTESAKALKYAFEGPLKSEPIGPPGGWGDVDLSSLVDPK